MKDLIATIRGFLLTFSCKIKRKDVSIGSGLKIFKRISILGNGKVVIGKNCHIDGMIGSNNFVCIQTFNSLAEINIGDNVNLHAARIASKFSVVIGDDVIIEDTNIVDTDFHTLDRSRATPSDENLMKIKAIGMEYHNWGGVDYTEEQRTEFIKRLNKLGFNSHILFLGSNNVLQMLYFWR